jgi:hypothetical protein
MADRRLVLIRQISERPAERRIEEDRIVAESTLASRRFRDQPFGHALDHLLGARWARERDHAAEAGGPPRHRHAAQTLEQELEPSPVVEPGAAEARRVEPGRAVERIDLDPGVVAEGQGVRQRRGSARLHERVLGVRRPGLFGQTGVGHIGQQLDVERHVAEEIDELAPLGGIERGEDQPRSRA